MRSRFSTSCSCSARLCFELSRLLLLLIKYGSAQCLCVLHFNKKNSFPWKIAECPLPTFTFKQFYEEKVGSEFSDRVLKQVFVGQTKESLDLVDYDLVVAEVLSVFGRYVKYNVIFFSQEEM